MKKFLYVWMCAAALLVIIFGTIYAAVQQMQRNDADYPQVQLAEDAAASLNRGASPMSAGSGAVGSVALESSLDPFVVVYDANGKPAGGNGYLYGNMPHIPMGVMLAARGRDYHRVTWQPASGVRIAAVAVAAKGYYVVSGRSMKLVEQNIQRTFAVALFGGMASLAVLSTAFAMVIPRFSASKNR